MSRRKKHDGDQGQVEDLPLQGDIPEAEAVPEDELVSENLARGPLEELLARLQKLEERVGAADYQGGRLPMVEEKLSDLISLEGRIARLENAVSGLDVLHMRVNAAEDGLHRVQSSVKARPGLVELRRGEDGPRAVEMADLVDPPDSTTRPYPHLVLYWEQQNKDGPIEPFPAFWLRDNPRGGCDLAVIKGSNVYSRSGALPRGKAPYQRAPYFTRMPGPLDQSEGGAEAMTVAG